LNINRDRLLKEAGIFYLPSNEYHNSHSPLYYPAASADWASLRADVSHMIESAERVGAHKMLISAERLFLLAENPEIFSRFIGELSDLAGGDLRVVLVVRAMKDYIRSYIIQLINNGSLYLEDTRLATWTIGLVRRIWELETYVTTVSFDEAVAKNQLVDRFCIALGCEDVRISETLANVTARRGHMFSTSLGVACRLMSLSRGVDVNSEEMDLERRAAERKFDLLHVDPSGEGMEYSGRKALLDEIVEAALNEYIDKCLAEVSREDAIFYQQLVSCSMSWNYAHFMADPSLRDVS